MDIVFFGTHNFAATILEGLLNSPVINIKKVITQPDKPVGRRQELRACPVKILAQKYGLEVEQPVNLKNYDLKIKNYDLNIVVDYGHIIPRFVIETPKFGSVNIHPSLLPKYRGPSPIQTALMNGDIQTGVTIMLVDEKMDHGPILAQESLQIDSDDNYHNLSQKLAEKAKESLLQAITKYLAGEIKLQPQDDSQATYCQMLDRADGLVDFNKTAVEIYNQYRGLTPWPGIYMSVQGQRIKLLKITLADKKINSGKIIFIKDKIYIGARDGSIEALELQLEGKKAMDAKSFINGYGYLENHQ